MRCRLVILSLLTVLLLGSGCSNKGTENTMQPATPATAPAPATDQPAKPKAPPAPPAAIVIPADTIIRVRLGQALSSKNNKSGDIFAATIADAIEVGENTVVPASSDAWGTVVEAKAKGKVKGEARLKLALTKIAIEGKTYRIETTMSAMTEKGKGKRTAATTGGGAGVGAIIGGIAGGGKGAGIGALVGGGAGFVGGALTGNKQIELPAKTPLQFRLAKPLTLK
jgi:hypothetical protein